LTTASRLRVTLLAALLLPGLLLPGLALADYYDDIGFRQMQAKLGAATPTGAGVLVVQVEGTQVLNGVTTWAPDPGTAEFRGRTITDRSGAPAGVYSGHATAVGTFLYGNRTSIAPGKTSVSVYEAGDWLGAGFLRAAGPAAMCRHGFVPSGRRPQTSAMLNIFRRQASTRFPVMCRRAS